MGLSLFFKFIISLLLGSMIGLEREAGNEIAKERWTLGGVRTFALISFLGSIAGFLFASQEAALAYILTGFIFIAILIYYFVTAFKAHITGLTTEISALLAYLIGFFILTNIIPIFIVVAFSIILILILSNKHRSKQFASNIDPEEWNSFLSFAIMLLVILPFLPNINYKLGNIPIFQSISFPPSIANLDIVNPYHLWLVVVLISGINLFSYVLHKKFGNRQGLYLSGFLGGLMSSTMTNHVLTNKSTTETISGQNNLAISNFLAFIGSLIPISFFIAILNAGLFIQILPVILLMIFVTIIFILFIKGKYNQPTIQTVNIPSQKKPDLFFVPAIKFALLLTAVKIISGLALIFWDNQGFLLASIISSLVGIDAIVINVAEMAKATISINYGIFVILIINIVNLFGKWIYSYWQGSRTFSRLNLYLLILISIISFIWYANII